MALLCTLHADGPKTLRILREAGCTSIEKLRSLESTRLSRLLGLSPAAARRLLREAALLEERLEPPLEREEVMFPPAASSSAGAPAPGYLRIAGPEEPPAVASKPRVELDLRDRTLLERVVDRWRKADRTARVESSEASGQESEPPPALPSEVEADQEPVAGAEVPSRPAREELHPGQVGGLDKETCNRLKQGGITSIEELATCPIDDLVERTQLSFTRARTLQFLAGRRLRANDEESAPVEQPLGPIVEPPRGPVPGPEAEATAEQPTRTSGSLPGLVEEGAGGPFA